MRQISVTIGVALKSDFHDSDYGQEHDQIPKPADKEIRSTPPQRENDPRYRDQKCGRERDLPPREAIVGMWVKYGEIRRPKYLPDVGNVSHQRVLKPPDKRQLGRRPN